MIRLVHCLRRRPDIPVEVFREQWRDVHGPLVAAYQARLGLLRHVQTHPDPAAGVNDEIMRAGRGGMAPPFDGIADYWWPSRDALRSALAEAEPALAHLAECEAAFVDLAASPLWLAREHPQVATQHLTPVARPKSGIVRLSYLLAPRPELDWAEAQERWLFRHGPLVRSHAAARGMIAYQQVHRVPEPDEDAALLRAMRGAPDANWMGHAEAWYDRLMPRSGPEVDAAAAAAIADERRFVHWSRSSLFTGKELVFVDRCWLDEGLYPSR